MSKDPHSGIDLDYLLDHLPPGALTDWVDRETAATGRKLRRSKYKHCPFPDHADSKPSFSVTEGKGWHCFGCTGPDGKGRRGTDVVSLVKQLRGYASMDDAIIEVATYYNVTRPQSPRRKRPPEAPRGPRNAQELLDHFLSLPDHSALSAGLHAALLSEEGAEGRAYLEGRGIFEASWIRHELGYVVPGSHPGAPLGPAWEGMITFPIRAGEHVINFAGRRIREGEPDKLNCLNLERWPFNMNALLLEEQEARQTVYVCEGPISALALEEMGCKPAVALLGSEIPEKCWPLFSRLGEEVSVVLCLDAKKGETEEQFDERQNATARRMRRLGWWRYMRSFASFLGAKFAETFPYYMDPADVWKASGFSPKIAASVLNPIVKLLADADQAHDPGLAYDVILPGPPDKDVAEVFAGAVAKNTPGLTLTLCFEDGPGLGHYLELTRADGRAFSLNMSQQPEVPQAKVLGIYARQDPTPAAENVYVQGEREVNRQLMAEIKKLRRRLRLAVADGLSPDLLNDLKGRRPSRSLSDEVRVPVAIAEFMTYRRPHETGEVASMEVVSPQSGRRLALVPRGPEGGQLEIPGVYAPLIPSDTKALLGLFRLFAGSPMRINTTFAEVAEALGTTMTGGDGNDLIWAQLNRLKTWWYWDANSESQWTFNFMGRLERFRDGRLVIDKSLAIHEALTGQLNKDYIAANWSKLERLSDQAIGLYVAYCLRSDPHYWQLDNIAAAVSSNKRPHKARAEAEKVLKELESVGIHVQDRTSPKGTAVKLLTAPNYTGRPFKWDKGQK